MKELIINGIHCENLLASRGYSVAYRKIPGTAGGAMLDGSTVEDILAIKATLNVELIPTQEQALYQLVESLYSSDYATVRYFDIRSGSYRTAEFIYNETELAHLALNAESEDIWQVSALTLTER